MSMPNPGGCPEEIMQYLRMDPAELMKQQAKTFDAKMVWIPSKSSELEGYLSAEVISTSGEMVSVKTEKGETKDVKKEVCDQMNPPKYEKCTDMANLTYLNEASVLYNLKARYQGGLIYTYSGLFCIAVNPYRRLPIYDEKVVQIYRGKRRAEMPPHVFSIVDNAYQDMLIEHDNQSMLITGESGAGKTENTKKVIQYIAKVAGVEKKEGAAGAAPPAAGDVAKIKGSLDEQIVEANPLLEAFGNAKTTRNNNSSRFGKFIRCHFSQTGKLAGADIESYLLEKNRVIHQMALERNYHIFYQIIYATTDEELSKLCLLTRDAKEYGFLMKGVPHVDKIDDHEEWGMTVNATHVLGFTEDESFSMWKICASILNFSNMKFKQKPRDEQAEVVDPADGERVSYLLGMNVGDFHKSLLKPKVKVGTEYVNKGQSVAQVLYAVSALSKALFERMFWWIVARVNLALDTKERRSYFIGVLDIAGFEIFEYNTFEQICINLTNEKLQQFFNHHMFVLEQEEYKKEGIFWEFIDFGMDLEETINLIEKPMGIFAMLEEECIVPKATDATYLAKLHKQHAGKTKAFTKPTPKQIKAGAGDFILHHYAGSVGYSVADWLEKNKDPINENTAQLFSKATDGLTASLFHDYNPDVKTKRKGSAFQTVSFRHKEQLKNLIGTLMSTSPHFVRCIIPNENKSPTEIDGQLCLHQLRCNGVLEGIRICRKGFPSRMTFGDFKQRYQILAASAIPTGFVDGKVAVEKLIEALQLDENEFRVGLTKVFFRAGIVGELEDMRDERLSKIISQFQAYCKGHLMRITYQKMLEKRIGLSVLQRNIRKFLMLRNWSWWKLYLKVLPLLTIARSEDEMKEKEDALKLAMENAEANEKNRKELEENLTNQMAEKAKLHNDLQEVSDSLSEAEEQLMKTTSERDQLSTSLQTALEKLEGEEHAANSLSDKVKAGDSAISGLKDKAEESKNSIAKLEGEKTSRDKQINALNEKTVELDEEIAKVGKEKRDTQESLDERTEQLQVAEDKGNALNKAKNIVEGKLKDTEHSLAKEQEAKAKVEKEKRAVEGVLKETQQKLEDTEGELKNTQDVVVKRDKHIKELDEKIEGNENLIKQLQKKIKELLQRIEDLEEELANEQKARQGVELAKKDLESSLEEVNADLLVSGGATAAQVEVAKKKDVVISALRREIDEINAANDAAAVAAKTKASEALAEAQEETENVKKAKAKSDKEKSGLAGQLTEVAGALDASKKQKASADKTARALGEQLSEVTSKLETTEAALEDLDAKSTKAAAEGAGAGAAVAELEHKLGLASKAGKALEAALAEAKSLAEDESKGKHDANIKLKNAQGDAEALAEQIEEEAVAKADLASKLSKATSEIAAWKTKYEEAGSGAGAGAEEAKKKLAAMVAELEDSLSTAETRAAAAEKAKSRLSDELDDMVADLEKAQSQASNLDKKQKKMDATINEWRAKVSAVEGDLDASQAAARSAAAELVKQRSANEEASDAAAAAKKENKVLASTVSGLTAQLSEGGGQNSAELEKLQRKLSAQNEELQLALEEAEGALEQEEGKLLKLTLELSGAKAAGERKAAEKDEEIEVARKNHSRQLEAVTGTLESESRGKAELQKRHAKASGDLIAMESALDAAVRAASDATKAQKKASVQVKDLSNAADAASGERDASREAISRAEARANDLALALDEARVAAGGADRAKKLAESAAGDSAERVAELQALYANAANGKRKAEGDFHALQEEIEDIEEQARAGDEKAARAAGEVAGLLAELTSSNQAAATADKSRALLAGHVADLQGQLEDIEAEGGKGLKLQIRQLESKVADLESDLATEGCRSADVAKLARRAEKKNKELLAALDEEHLATARAKDGADKLNARLDKVRLGLEEAEQVNANLNSRLKKSVAASDDAESRAKEAEGSLQKVRARSRAATRGASRGEPSA